MDDMDDIEDLLEAPYKTAEKSLAQKTATLDNNEVSRITHIFLTVIFLIIQSFFYI